MSDRKPLLQTVPLSLNNNDSGGTSTHNLQGAKFVRIEKSDYPVKVYLDDVYIGELKTAGYLRVGAGSTGISKITVENTTTENNKVVLQYGDVLVGTDESIISTALEVEKKAGNEFNVVTSDVTTTVTKLLSSNSNRGSVLLKNIGVESIYILPNTSMLVTDGWELKAGKELEIELSCDVFVACSAGSSKIKYMEGLHV